MRQVIQMICLKISIVSIKCVLQGIKGPDSNGGLGIEITLTNQKILTLMCATITLLNVFHGHFLYQSITIMAETQWFLREHVNSVLEI